MNWAHLTDSNLSCPLCILVIVHGLVTIDLFIDLYSLLTPAFFSCSMRHLQLLDFAKHVADIIIFSGSFFSLPLLSRTFL